MAGLFAAIMALAVVELASGGAASRPIYIKNFSELPDGQVLNALPAFQLALDRDFSPIWGQNAELVFLGDKQQIPSRGWTITLQTFDRLNCFFCLGYHETHRGIPRGFVGDMAGADWHVTFTHELFEMLGDPYINKFARVGKRFYIMENADAVEDDSFAYPVPGADGTPIMVSDFVTPEWFVPDAKGPYDFRLHVKRPFQLLYHGYIGYMQDGKWHALYGPGWRPEQPAFYGSH